VSLLKDLGASPVLTMQIQGESLLNDGTAIVLFTVAYKLVSAEDYGPSQIIGFLFQSTLGAGLLGATIGGLFYLWLRAASDKLNHLSPLIQISLTLLCAYWSFIVAEGFFHISGVLSTVAAAFVLAHNMWPVVVERRSMQETWHVIEIVGNTMVFFLAGVLTGSSMMQSSFVDYLWTVLMYIIMIMLRFVMLLILRPFLNLVGERVSFADICVMTWGGLRGMVGLALGILVRQDRAKGQLSIKDGNQILFLVSGIAALTLVVNATTSPSLCKFLGITQASEARKVLLWNVARRAETHVWQVLNEVSMDKRQVVMTGFVKEAIAKIVEEIKHDLPNVRRGSNFSTKATASTSQGCNMSCPTRSNPSDRSGALPNAAIDSWRHSWVGGRRRAEGHISWLHPKPEDPNIQALWFRFEEKRKELLLTGATVEIFQYGKQLDLMRKVLPAMPADPQQLKVVREVFLQAVRTSYWEQLQRGRFLVGSSEPAILLNSVNLAKDKCCTGLEDWTSLEHEVIVDEDDPSWMSSTAINFSDPSSRFSLLGWIRRHVSEWGIRRHFSRQMRAVQIIDAFIEAHRKAQTQICEYWGADTSVDSAEEIFVVIESQIEIYQAAIARSKIKKTVQVMVNTMWRVHFLAEEYRNFVITAHESGILQAKEAEMLMHPIAHAMHNLQRDRKQITQALRKDACMKTKSLATKLTRVDAAMRIQRFYRLSWKRRNHLVGVMQNRHSVFGPMEVEDVESTLSEVGSTASGKTSPAPVLDSAQSGVSFAAVLPHTPGI